jgi:auxin-responsive protein IAA
MESSDKFSQRSNNGLNLKATELRLGLPGSESPERDNDLLEEKNAYSLCMLNGLFSRAKRGFSDAIEIGLKKDSSNQQGSVVKDRIQQSSNPLNEKKKSQIYGSAAKYFHFL